MVAKGNMQQIPGCFKNRYHRCDRIASIWITLCSLYKYMIDKVLAFKICSLVELLAVVEGSRVYVLLFIGCSLFHIKSF